MFKMIAKIFLALTLITIIAVTVLYFNTRNRTYYNNEDEIGNTTANIYNGGLFCERDEQIYFSNPYDNGKLYVMSSNLTNIRKLSDKKTVYINADSNYLYYVLANNIKENNKKGTLPFSNSGVYRINQNGTDLKAFTGNPSAYLILHGNYIYSQQYRIDQGITLYRYKIDGTDEKRLQNKAAFATSVSDDTLYYTGTTNDRKLYSQDLESFTTKVLSDGSYLYPIFVEDKLYYIDTTKNNNIYISDREDFKPSLLVKHNCSTYNITNSGKYLYYLAADKKGKGIYRMDLDTGKEKLLKKGSFKQISVTENYVFFNEHDNTNTYFLVADGGTVINTFDTLFATE
ncbi:MAG: DUF5050 domain-containing protein [Mobilitalea sp.]